MNTLAIQVRWILLSGDNRSGAYVILKNLCIKRKLEAQGENLTSRDKIGHILGKSASSFSYEVMVSYL